MLPAAGDATGRSHADGGAEEQMRHAAASLCHAGCGPAAAPAGHGDGQ